MLCARKTHLSTGFKHALLELIAIEWVVMIQEVFVETCWEEEAIARQRRDARRQELEATGMECQSEDLYTVDGRRVFVVLAMPAGEFSVAKRREREGTNGTAASARTTPRPRPGRRSPEYEER